MTELSNINADKENTVSVKVKITNKELRNVSTGSILEMMVTDGKAYARCIAWNNMASFFYKKLDVDQTYEKSDIAVRKIKPQYQYQGTLDIELILSAGVNIKICTQEIISPETAYCSISDLNQVISKRVNIIGVVKSFEKQPSTIITQRGNKVLKREITIVDDSLKEAQATLWGEDTDKYDLEHNPVVKIKNSPVKSFQNKVFLWFPWR